MNDQEIAPEGNSFLPGPLELILQEQSDKVCEAMRNEPIPSSSTNSDNILIDSASPSEKDKELPGLSKRTKNLSIVPPPKFVINTIAKVPDREFDDDSSSEETDGRFSDDDFNFYHRNKYSFPFTTTRKKGVSKKEIDFEEITNSNESDSISRIIIPFLDKLSQNGFEKEDKDKLTTSISASIALNRMKSLSTRKNKSLDLELNSKEVDTSIRYEKFGFFWFCAWYNKSGETVDQSLVRKFYKQLKRINPERAQEFIREMEKNIDVPYQRLRDYAKNHYKTTKLVQEFRKKDHDAYVYLSLIDIDTVDFNGIYSAYLRIVKGCEVKLPVPTVMSTGFEYPKDKPDYQFASQVDRMIRVITARFIPLGVYYPEPNTCVLIEQGRDTLLEIFIDKTRSKGNLESACLLKKIQNRENAKFIFSDDKPLITTIPDRAKLTKVTKSSIPFSSEFTQGVSRGENDFILCKQVAQSSLSELNWINNLFINGAIKFLTYDLKDYVKNAEILQDCNKLLKTAVNKSKKSEDRNSAIGKLKDHLPPDILDVMVKKNVLQHCKHLISKFRSFKKVEIDKDNKEGINTIRNELKKYIAREVVNKIIEATKNVKRYINKEKVYVKDEEEDKLLSIFTEYGIENSSLFIDQLQMLAQQPVLNLIEKKLINLQDLIELDTEVLESICYDEEILEMLENKTIDFDCILNILIKHFSDFIDAKQEYSISDILDKYEENPIHLKFMADDPDIVVLQNLNDEEIIKLGIDCYTIDIDWVRSNFSCADRNSEDYEIPELMIFNSIVRNNIQYRKHERSDEESSHYDEEPSRSDNQSYYEESQGPEQ